MDSVDDFIFLTPGYKLTIDFPFEQNVKSEISAAVQQAVNSGVKEMILNLKNGDIGSSSFYPLPSLLYKNSVLKRLDLSMCNFDFLPEVIWYSLKVLKIRYTYLDNTYINIIVCGCPVLEELELCNCWGFSELNLFNLPKLKKFELDGIWPKVVEDQIKTDSLSISAPTVQVLEILGNLDHKDLVLRDLNNCFEAKIDYFWTSEEDRRRPLSMKPVFNSLKNVQILTCGSWIIEVASDKFEAEFPYSLENCNSLTIHSPVEYRHQLGIMRFIESCPNVGTLTIDISPSSPLELKSDEESDLSMGINSEAEDIKLLKFPNGFPFKDLKTLCNDKGTIYSSLPYFLKYLADNTTRPVETMQSSFNIDFGLDGSMDSDDMNF